MPLMSVIITTCNRSGSLLKTLNSIISQEIDPDIDYELLILDNCSSDDTKEKVGSYASNFSGKMRYLYEPKRGKVFALNKGVENAKGEILVFTDDDVILDTKWLSSIWRCFKKYNCDGVGGRILPVYPPNTPQWVKDHHNLITGPLVMYDLGEDAKRYETPMHEFLGANYAFNRRVFDDCGLFRTDVGPGIAYVGEDTEFVNRAFKAGKNLYYCGQALVWHPTELKRMNLRYIAKWYVGLGKYRFLVDEKNKFDSNLTCYFGVPRYLIRVIFLEGISLSVKFFNKREFLKSWKSLFINIGKAIAMRKSHYLITKQKTN